MSWRAGVRISCLMLLAALPEAHAAAPACADGTAARPHESCLHPAAVPQPDADAATRRYLFWKVSTPGSTVYLLGSIHFGRPEMYPLSAAIEQAYARADALVVEADVTRVAPEEAAAQVSAKAFYPPGTELKQHLSAETWRRVEAAADGLQIPAVLLARQRPWFASLSLSALAMQRYGYSDQLGVDVHFLKLAGERKRVIELESFQQQLALFDAFSEDEQASMLRQTLDDLARGPELLNEIAAAWQAGDEGTLDVLLNEQFRGDAAARHLYQVLVVDRNAAMADKLAALMQRGGVYFVVVGAAHLVGDRGVVRLLRARDYAIERP